MDDSEKQANGSSMRLRGDVEKFYKVIKLLTYRKRKKVENFNEFTPKLLTCNEIPPCF